MMQPSSTGFLDVGQGHKIFYRIYGPEDGVPFVFLHGGPGSGFSESYSRFFEGQPIRLIAFDQRGAGKSEPKGINPDNTTQHLIDDIETLRKFLGIDKWLVAGHSWGSTLAFFYALQHKDQCLGLVLSSLFLGRKRDQDWSFDGAKIFFPDIFEKICDGLPAGQTFEEYLYQDLLNGTDAQKHEAAYRFALLGSALVRLVPVYYERDEIGAPEINMLSQLVHYAKNGFFVPENHILDNAAVLKNLPIWLLHGRFDMDCLPMQTYELQKILPQIDLRIVGGAHSLSEVVMEQAFYDIIKDVALLGK
jgi:proline iminopeptidase